VVPIPFIEEAVFSPMHTVGSLVENQMNVAVWAYIWVFYSINLRLFVCHAGFDTMALKNNLKSGIVILPTLHFLLTISLAILGLLCFNMNLRVTYFCEE
jgi:hypothetical protein